MTKEMLYSCNLCMRGISNTGPAGKSPGYAVKTGTGKFSLLDNLDDGDRHICASCVEGIVALKESKKPAMDSNYRGPAT